MIAAFALLPGSFINHNPFHQSPDVLHFPLKVSRLRTNTLATLVAYIDILKILATFTVKFSLPRVICLKSVAVVQTPLRVSSV
jgi:hypothetical protein